MTEGRSHLPVVWLVDVDGTLALSAGRSPYDWRRADSDLPNQPVVTAVQALAAHPQVEAVLVISGREEQSRGLTEEWLRNHSVPFSEVFMRQNGDYRPDDVVKEELFRKHIEPRYIVAGIIDDRDRVVHMWRRLGLTCFQVAEGDF